MKNILLIATISVSAVAASAQITAPEGDKCVYDFASTQVFDEDGYTEMDFFSHGGKIVIFNEESGDVYLNPFSRYECTSYIHGVVNGGNSVVFEFPQVLETKAGKSRYAMVFEGYVEYGDVLYKGAANQKMTFSLKNGVMEYMNTSTVGGIYPKYIIGITDWMNEGDTPVWGKEGDSNFTFTPSDNFLIEAPEDLQWEAWHLEHYAYFDHKNRPILQRSTAYVGTCQENGESVLYIKGIYPRIPELVIKGKIGSGKVTFPTHQLVGLDRSKHVFMESANFNLHRDEDTGLWDPQFGANKDYLTFAYDSKKKQLISVDESVIMSGASVGYNQPNYVLNPKLFGFDPSLPTARPAKPSVNHYLPYDEAELCRGEFLVTLPNFDVNGNDLDTSKMYYTVYFNGYPYKFRVDGESTEKVPYRYDDGIFFDHNGMLTYVTYLNPGVEEIGVQLVYVMEDGTELKSDMAYSSDEIGSDPSYPAHNPNPDEVKWDMSQPGKFVGTGIDAMEDMPATVVARYSIDGTKVAADYQGIQIVVYSNGKSKKVLYKK